MQSWSLLQFPSAWREEGNSDGPPQCKSLLQNEFLGPWTMWVSWHWLTANFLSMYDVSMSNSSFCVSLTVNPYKNVESLEFTLMLEPGMLFRVFWFVSSSQPHCPWAARTGIHGLERWLWKGLFFYTAFFSFSDDVKLCMTYYFTSSGKSLNFKIFFRACIVTV